MEIILKELRISNFKGITNKTISFGPETNIHGANATGKTTIADAWYWLLFGKNSSDDTKFNIKNTVDASLNEQDHEVEALLTIDGERTVIKRVYREKWTKKRGREQSEYTGNEQRFSWNDVPLQLKEYNAKIAAILNDELFKKITNPGYFNMIPWQKRRETLIAMAGDVTLQDVAGANPDFLNLLEKLGKESLEEYRKKLAARISKLKDDLLHLPARIKELKATLPEDEPDFAGIELSIRNMTEALNTVDVALQNKTVAQQQFQDEQADIQSRINKQNRDLEDLKHKLTIDFQKQDRESLADIQSTKQSIASLESSITQLHKDKAETEKRISAYGETLKELRAEWAAINAEKFGYPEFKWDDHEETCPTCQQKIPTDAVDTRKATLKANYDNARKEKETAFNNSKARRLQDNKNAGTNANISQKNSQEKLQQLNENIAIKQNSDLFELKSKLVTLESKYTTPAPIELRVIAALNENSVALAILTTIEGLESQLKEEPTEDNADLKAKKAELVKQLADLNKQLGQKDTIVATKARIEKLMKEEKDLNQQRADAEREDDIRLRFEKARIEMMVSQVNGLFQYVTFKLFDTTIDGGEFPVCETMLDGVPYSDLNTAGRMKAGIDIINALSKHYGILAPIFLDNRESVTRIPDTPSQVINLIVSPADKKLRIEHAQMEEAV